MAFTLANLVRVVSVPSGLNDATTTTDNGFGGTVTRQTEPHTIWAYAENAAVTAMDEAGYFAAAGSDTGTGQLKTGDVVILFGTTTGIAYVTSASAGTVSASNGVTFA